MSTDLTDVVVDWMRKVGKLADVPHVHVLETRNGPIDIVVRGTSGLEFAASIPNERAASLRDPSRRPELHKALVDLATECIAHVTRAPKAAEPKPEVAKPDERAAEQQVIAADFDRRHAASAKAKARTA